MILKFFFGLGNRNNLSSTLFVLSFYDMQNEVSHDRNTLQFISPNNSYLGVECENPNHVKKYLRHVPNDVWQLYVGEGYCGGGGSYGKPYCIAYYTYTFS